MLSKLGHVDDEPWGVDAVGDQSKMAVVVAATLGGIATVGKRPRAHLLVQGAVAPPIAEVDELFQDLPRLGVHHATGTPRAASIQVARSKAGIRLSTRSRPCSLVCTTG